VVEDCAPERGRGEAGLLRDAALAALTAAEGIEGGAADAAEACGATAPAVPAAPADGPGVTDAPRLTADGATVGAAKLVPSVVGVGVEACRTMNPAPINALAASAVTMSVPPDDAGRSADARVTF
jgi:hypothetical protein